MSLQAMLMYPNHYPPAAKEFWEREFAKWRAPATDAEERKINHTLSEVRTAIDANQALRGILRPAAQGSFHNNTNVPGESDVDVRLMYPGRFLYNVQPTNFQRPNPLGFGQYIGPSDGELKAEILSSLWDHFGRDNVEYDGKCFEIHANQRRVDADIILAYPYYHFQPAPNETVTLGTNKTEGILFYNGTEEVINYPDQHHELGKAKNVDTGRRYKAVVRALKTFNLEMTTPLKSFFVEGLVFNCENTLFQSASIYEDVQNVCNKILRLFQNPHAESTWTEPNLIKPLFAGNGRTVQDAALLAYYAKQRMEQTS